MTCPILSCQVPVLDSCLPVFEQAVVTLPLRGQSAGSPIQVQASRGQASLTVPGLASAVTVTKPQMSSPASPAHKPKSPAVLQGVSSQNIIKQVQTALDSVYTRNKQWMHDIWEPYWLLENIRYQMLDIYIRHACFSSYAYLTLLLH